jgi:hypothetical protein
VWDTRAWKKHIVSNEEELKKVTVIVAEMTTMVGKSLPNGRDNDMIETKVQYAGYSSTKMIQKPFPKKVAKKKKKKVTKPKALDTPKVQKKSEIKFGEGDEFTDAELYGISSDEEPVLNADIPPSVPVIGSHESDPQLIEEEKNEAEESEYEYGEESEDEHK